MRKSIFALSLIVLVIPAPSFAGDFGVGLIKDGVNYVKDKVNEKFAERKARKQNQEWIDDIEEFILLAEEETGLPFLDVDAMDRLRDRCDDTPPTDSQWNAELIALSSMVNLTRASKDKTEARKLIAESLCRRINHPVGGGPPIPLFGATCKNPSNPEAALRMAIKSRYFPIDLTIPATEIIQNGSLDAGTSSAE